MIIKGKLKMIGETQTFGANGFEKRECVVTTEEQYPQDILIEFTQQRCDLLDACSIGQDVQIHFNLRGREWINPQGEAKYFNTLQGWKIEAITTSAVSSPSNTPPTSPADAFKPASDLNEEDHDDLPF